MIDLSLTLTVVKDALTALALITGGLWTWFLYVRKRIGAWNVLVLVNPVSTSYDGDRALLVCQITLRNTGNVYVVPGPKGCEVTIRRVPSDLRVGDLVEWNESLPLVLPTHNLLALYLRAHPGRRDYEGIYGIEPGGEYHEQTGIVLERGFIYLVQTTFWWSGKTFWGTRDSDSITEYAHIRIE